MNVSRIRGFLLQLPKPALVRLTTGDGEPTELKLQKSFAKTAESIAALGSELIEALDASGKVLRAMRTDTAEAHRSEAPALPAGLAADPNALLLAHFAGLLHRAYEHSTEIAFTKMVELVDKMGDRSESIEQRLERAEAHNRRLINEQIEDAFERAREVAEKAEESNGGDLLSQMGSAFLSGQLQPRAPRAPAAQTNGKSNGKGHG